jgi:hypothetical protein
MAVRSETPAARSMRTGAQELSSLGGSDGFKNSLDSPQTQAPNRRRDHLRLVPAVRAAHAPIRPIPHLNVRISAFAGPMPHGRSRAFSLTPNQLNELLGHANRLEARRER